MINLGLTRRWAGRAGAVERAKAALTKRGQVEVKPVHGVGDDQATHCGQWAAHRFLSTTDAAQITCKRCLACIRRRANLDARADKLAPLTAQFVEALEKSGGGR